ncbi:MAG: xanthine dehydrogenase [Pelotomaculum sp.]|uniref:Xanthine and CO dehydrogenases maturation factor n=1 Tax=Pelotomaculum thermopropionicum (strain DSM 13744 / JCM 10971 / SI) TaxID=370438 RepID=A5D219_PELTS|nr:xanthine dehydrogenase [Pelotomaculum sp.]BAF59716.1 xanthine and CO dehydrogenases maturation factor [Pelotomaculum thermopropionicum SI]
MNGVLERETAIVTVIGQEGMPENLIGQKKVIAFNGEVKSGDMKLPWLEEQVAALIRGNAANLRFQIEKFFNLEKPEQSVTVMIDPYLPPRQLIILGGGHIAVPVASIALLLDYQVTVVDDRPEYISADRFPGVHRRICCSFHDIEKVLSFGPECSVLIVTRGHKHDLDCLRTLIKYPVAYLGMIGSRRKIEMARQQLIQEGIESEKLARVYMPVGLDIGAETPAEIAVSIAAEMIKVYRGGSANSLKTGGTGKIAHPNDTEMPSSADIEVIQNAVKACREGLPAAVATIVRTAGSTPRKAGAKMLIFREGRIIGTIGGGCGESEVRLEAFNVIDDLKPRVHKISLNADIAASEGMVCGGTMEVFIEPVSTFSGILTGGEE